MSPKKSPTIRRSPVQRAVRRAIQPAALSAKPTVKGTVRSCDDCRALEAFHAWRDETLNPSFNVLIDFATYGIPPAGRRAVIELVAASVQVLQAA